MAIEDNTVYGLTGAQIKELPGKIEAVKGLAKVLTTADYNYPTDNPTSVALWLLKPGMYKLGENMNIRRASSVSTSYNAGQTFITLYDAGATGKMTIVTPSETTLRLTVVNAAGSLFVDGPLPNGVTDFLASTSATSALSANQGRVLKGLIDAIEVPTKTSDLTNDGSDGTSTYVEADELATVATTGAYTDITGIPTNVSDFTNDADYQTGSQVSTAIGVETTARQNADVNLQGQIDAIVASSDVKDIVGTKAELNAYDTSTLGDKDIIKVLQDESENNATTYYRWSTTTSTFTLIGEEGPYYTKAEADTLLNAKANASTTYTKSEVDTALSGKVDNATLNDYATTSAMNTALAGKANTADVYTKTQVDTALDGKADASTTYTKTEVDTALDAKANTADLAIVATTNSYNDLDNLPTLPTIVQTTGTSQTNVMSQNAITSMVYADPANKTKVQIGGQASGGSLQVAIGYLANASNNYYACAIGANSKADAAGAVAMGCRAVVSGLYGIALGYGAKATTQGQFDVSTGDYTTNGYNNSNYRLLTGLYDPQNAHDAATKGYVDTSITTAISGIVGVEFEVVQTLPATGDAGTIYLVPNQGTTPNIYDEYIYVNNAFEKIGTTEIDLSNYVTTTDLNTALADYTTTANLATVATTGDFNDLTNTPTTFTTNEWNALWA